MKDALKFLDPYLKKSEVTVKIYTCQLLDDGKFNIEKMPLHGESQDSIKNKFIENLEEHLKEKELLEFSSYDDRNNVIYKYDLPLTEGRLKELSDFEFAEELNDFNGDFTKIYGLIYEIGDADKTIICYKQNYAINAFGEKQFLGDFAGKAFKLLSTPVYRLTPFADVIFHEKSPYILNLKVLEKHFGIEESLKKRAETTIETIEKLDILENTSSLSDRVVDISFSRKLMKIKKDSPVLSLDKDKIINFTKTDAQLKGSFSYSENGLIVLDSKKAQNIFLKLLNDDFLHSRLTGTEYISKAKDRGEGSI